MTNPNNYRSVLAKQALAPFRNRHHSNSVARESARTILNSFFYYGRLYRFFHAGNFPLDRATKKKLQSHYNV